MYNTTLMIVTLSYIHIHLQTTMWNVGGSSPDRQCGRSLAEGRPLSCQILVGPTRFHRLISTQRLAGTPALSAPPAGPTTVLQEISGCA